MVHGPWCTLDLGADGLSENESRILVYACVRQTNTQANGLNGYDVIAYLDRDLFGIDNCSHQPHIRTRTS